MDSTASAALRPFPPADPERRRVDLVRAKLATLRQRLLDLTNRNRLLNFRHSDTARWHIRVVDELPDQLFATLAAGRTLHFKCLPPLPEEPADERTPEFQAALDEAKLTDEAYRKAVIEAEERGDAEDSLGPTPGGASAA